MEGTLDTDIIFLISPLIHCTSNVVNVNLFILPVLLLKASLDLIPLAFELWTVPLERKFNEQNHFRIHYNRLQPLRVSLTQREA